MQPTEQLETTALPLWREALLGLDWLSLRASAVYRGIGIPRGDGSAVVVIPGFLGSDQYLGDLYTWLRRVGYQPHMSSIGRNIECPNVLTDRLRETIENAQAQSGGKVHLIGHSLGGMLARAAAVRWPRPIASVITMAAPFRGVRAHPLILQVARLVRGRISAHRGDPSILQNCYTGQCSCDFVNSLRRPFPRQVAQTAIYTKSDGIVDWRGCVSEDPDTDIEVRGAHLGLVFNPEVYHHIALRLAFARGKRRKR